MPSLSPRGWEGNGRGGPPSPNQAGKVGGGGFGVMGGRRGEGEGWRQDTPHTHTLRPGKLSARDPPPRSPCICRPWRCAGQRGNASGNGGSQGGNALTAGAGTLAQPATLQTPVQRELGAAQTPFPGREGLIIPATAPLPPTELGSWSTKWSTVGKLRQLKCRRDTPSAPTWCAEGSCWPHRGGGGVVV